MFARGDQRNRGNVCKLAILGDGGVGKTALTIQLCLNQFVETYDPTIEDSYRKKLLLDGKPVTLEILDTAGQEEYTALRDQWIRDAEGFVICYSITSRETFTRINQYYEQIMRVKEGEDYSCVLVANKCDRNDERAVSVNEGKQLAKKLDCTFYETSAKLNINAEAAFVACARETRDIREEQQEQEQQQQQQQQQSEEVLNSPDNGPGAPVSSNPNPPQKTNSFTAKKTTSNAQTQQVPEASKPKKKKCSIM